MKDGLILVQLEYMKKGIDGLKEMCIGNSCDAHEARVVFNDEGFDENGRFVFNGTVEKVVGNHKCPYWNDGCLVEEFLKTFGGK